MNTSITLSGIDQAIELLNYTNPHAPKYKLIHTIRRCYLSEESIDTTQSIDTSYLIKEIWNIEGDPSLIQSKLKNLQTIRSTVNTDLKKLFEQGKITEGLSIGPTYIFELSETAKDDLLKSFKYAIKAESGKELESIASVLSMIRDLVKSSSLPKTETLDTEKTDILKQMNEIFELLSGKPNIDIQKYDDEKQNGKQNKPKDTSHQKPIFNKAHNASDFAEKNIDADEVVVEDAVDTSEIGEDEISEEEVVEELEDVEIKDAADETEVIEEDVSDNEITE
ncbi:MAG: hypothetical protein HQK77_14960, partial [Desulfobacterales bacterium]|nr:hypothetical protein [Desulfobacterales bacterium]